MALGGLKGTLVGNANSVSTSIAAAGSVVVAVGDLVYAVIGEQTTSTATTVADNLGHSYTATQVATDAGTSTGRAYYVRVTTAGTLTAVTFTTNGGTNNAAVIAAVIEGPVLVSPLDANPTNITTDITSPFTCPATGTLAQANEIVMAWGVGTGSTVWAATSPNLLADNQATQAILKVAIGYQLVASTTTVSPAFTAASNPTDAVLGTSSFKASGAVSASPTTAAGTGASGTPTVVGKAIVSITGIAATGAAGTPTVAVANHAYPTGVAAIGAAGHLNGNAILDENSVIIVDENGAVILDDGGILGKASVTATGINATGAAGTPTVSGKANVSITGVAATGAAGSPTIAIGITTNPTGVSATGSAGTPTITGAANVNVTGVAATASAGSPTVTAAANTTLTGAQAIAAAGTPTVSGKANVTPAGVEASAQTGTLVANTAGNVSVAITGVAASAFAGDPAAIAAANILLSGLAAAGQVGTLTASGASGAISVQLSGVSASGAAGTVSVSADAVRTGGGWYPTPEELARMRQNLKDVEDAKDRRLKHRRKLDRDLTETLEKVYRRATGQEPEAAEVFVEAIAAEMPEAVKPATSSAAVPEIDWRAAASNLAAMRGLLDALEAQARSIEASQAQRMIALSVHNAKIQADALEAARIAADEHDIEILLLM